MSLSHKFLESINWLNAIELGQAEVNKNENKKERIMQESEVSQITKRMKGQRALTGYCYTDFWLMGFLAL